MQDLLGWLAAALMLSTFACREMIHLRILALGASLAFIGWAIQSHLMPVLVLHLVLLPIHLQRMAGALASRRQEAERKRALRPSDLAASRAEAGRSPRDSEDPACVCLANPR